MKSTKSKAAIAFVAFILVFSITHFAKFPGSVEYFKEITNDQPLLDLKPEFSKSGVYERLESFGNEGRTAYLQLLPTIDLIFPISAFIFFSDSLSIVGVKIRLTLWFTVLLGGAFLIFVNGFPGERIYCLDAN